jgi:F-box interacting protein
MHTPWTPFEFSSAGIGFDPATGEHKVVRLFLTSRKQQKPKCEVYTMGSAGAWRPCDVPPDIHGYFLSALPPVTVNGSFYWLLQTYRWHWWKKGH